ncbi:MAG: phosphodiester glycosidase family protein [Eubacteriales bacterium]
MQTYTADEIDIDEIKSKGAYQAWTFGPMLLDGGQPMEEFNSDLNARNPRTAIGYYEPGHYCFVVVDGRQPGYSNGYSLKALSQLFYNLGCKAAFNLDGGQTSEMVFEGDFFNQPYNGGRSVSDILYIVDE